jgi:hypothetical protein
VLSIKRNWCFRDLFYPARGKERITYENNL